ncbi:DeoR/GlpR family DNA-binding transcription regulator [Clostridium sp. KNHs205]|jgi:DeoR family transcriptional regulator, fructose operon transcriptional repressor|uniref:DeoR/GlpR family DNA-binding transcription regulator n=1 Tax=Clostridium sp. KNHs205 TaxID=1449050 RepID=UPI00051C34F6|nr:DeoR/GlpR family DNA-binding transcription regulator [Clostridium sp. KNHs205]
MLTEKRFEEILRLVDEKGMVTLQELKNIFAASESTLRRDLTTLHNSGKLVKVFGGAMSLDAHYRTKDIEVPTRREVNREEKLRIAEYGASLIGPDDFVYLDAGTTTGYMIDFIQTKQATFVTNGVNHAQRLAAAGLHVILIGGELKASTEAVVGSEATIQLQKYHFTLGFLGANGIHQHSGFSTPDNNEAMIKQIALKQIRRPYILCDHSKFGQISPVTFGDLDHAVIITDRVDKPEYKKLENIIILNEA